MVNISVFYCNIIHDHHKLAFSNSCLLHHSCVGRKLRQEEKKKKLRQVSLDSLLTVSQRQIRNIHLELIPGCSGEESTTRLIYFLSKSLSCSYKSEIPISSLAVSCGCLSAPSTLLPTFLFTWSLPSSNISCVLNFLTSLILSVVRELCALKRAYMMTLGWPVLRTIVQRDNAQL